MMLPEFTEFILGVIFAFVFGLSVFGPVMTFLLFYSYLLAYSLKLLVAFMFVFVFAFVVLVLAVLY